MDLHIELSLLLLLAYSIGGQCNNTRDGPPSSPHYHRRIHHHNHRPLQRQTRALSEFLVPPPMPLNFRGARGPPSLTLPPSVQHQSNSPPLLPLQGQHSRNGRYINQGPAGINNVPGYFSKVMNWLNPFNRLADRDRTISKDNHGLASSIYAQQQRLSQYAPHQPYTSATVQHSHYQSPASSPALSPSQASSGYSNLATQMSDKSCNPCNEVPWTPVLHQYAPNAHIETSLHMSPGYPDISPPLYDAKPFNTAAAEYSSIGNQGPPSSFEHHSSSLSQPTSFDHPPDLGHSSAPIYDKPPSPVYNHQQSIELDHPPSNYDEPQSSDFDSQPPPDYHSNSNLDSQAPANYDEHHHASPNFEQHHQSSQTVNIIKEAPRELDPSKSNNRQQEPDHAESRPVFVNSDSSNTVLPDTTQATIYESNHDLFATATTSSPSRRQPQYSQNGPKLQNVYFHRSPLIDLSVAGESSTTTTTTSTTRSTTAATAGGKIVTTASYRGEKRYHPITTGPSEGKLSEESPVIDYIVSGADELDSNEVERETRPPKLYSRQQPQHHSSLERIVVQPSKPAVATTSTTTTTTTTSTTITTTQRAIDQKSQDSNVQTLVQSYEFYRKKNDNDTKSEERLGVPGRIYNETEDYSASRELVVPNKVDENVKKNKQIIQIIIPYTSQYTPSPFHSTKFVNKHKKDRVPVKSAYSEETSNSSEYLNTFESDEDNVVIEESRRIAVTRSPPTISKNKLRNDSRITDVLLNGKMDNSIDVHRLQKNIDNWTIQEYSKSTKSITNSPNSTHPRWIPSKQIPDEYLSSTTEVEESNEYYDSSNETKTRGTNKLQVTSTPKTVTKIDIINATYPRKANHGKKRVSSIKSNDSERVYVVTPIPNPNSLKDLSSEKDTHSRRPKIKEHLETAASSSSREDVSAQVERAYQVLPQAVNNLAVLSNAPESAAPALWGIMEHEEFAASADQPRWRSEADVLQEPSSTPVLYAGHSKVSRAR